MCIFRALLLYNCAYSQDWQTFKRHAGSTCGFLELWNPGVPESLNPAEAMYIYCVAPALPGVNSHDSQSATHIWIWNSGILEFCDFGELT